MGPLMENRMTNIIHLAARRRMRDTGSQHQESLCTDTNDPLVVPVIGHDPFEPDVSFAVRWKNYIDYIDLMPLDVLSATSIY